MKGNIAVFSNSKKGKSYQRLDPIPHKRPNLITKIYIVKQNNPLRNHIEKEMSEAGKKLLNEAQSPEVKDLVKELYRPGATIGDGGTADAVRYELRTGKKVGSKSHIKKAEQRLSQINKILNKNNNHVDKELLIKLKITLEDALKGVK